ncbi:MAG: PBP1A family penicillin-binding protein [Acetobacteraceae bacterium]|nr:PBP1A family penicillin-binding protein [Acetobacteraceae bacterium]
MDQETRVASPIPKRRSRAGRARRRRSPWRGVLYGLLIALGVLALGAAGGAAGFVVSVVRSLPPLETIGEPRPHLTSFIYAADGQVIAELHRAENRVPVDISQVPKVVQDAFVASEDHRFWEHRGADFFALARALYLDLVHHSYVQGASTITMQLVKNAFTGQEKTLKRKLQDIILAMYLERKFTKSEILEMYLNQVFFGHDAYGIQAAAQTYFGKDCSQLTLAEGALLAGLVQTPNEYSPYVSLERARSRRQTALNLMQQYGFITAEQAAQASREPIKLAGLKPAISSQAPHFTDYVTQLLIKTYGEEAVFEGGLKVYTTVDLAIQRAAEEAIKAVLDPVFPITEGKEQPQAAAVVLEPSTGYIRAMVGGRTYSARMELNRAVQSFRQPGSAFKPIVAYTPAIDLGYTAASVIDDAPVQYRQADGTIWAPTNYDLRHRGLTPLRDGLQWSINVMAVRLLEQIGVEAGLGYAQRMGISSLATSGRLNDCNLSLALGGLTKGVSPLELTSAFSVLANQGVRAEPQAILKVVDKEGNVLEQNQPRLTVVLRPGTAYIVTSMLRTAVEAGTGKNALIPGVPMAGKTGTTTDNVDAWFIGYTPTLTAGVWMGYDQPKEMEGAWGGTYPAQIWKKLMTEALKGKPPVEFEKPANMVEVSVCVKSGQRPGPLCPPEAIRTECFLKGTQPREQCQVHVQATVCSSSGKLPSAACPPELLVTRTFIKRSEPWSPYTDEKGRTFAPEDAVLEVPTEVCPVHAPPVAGGEEPPSAAPLPQAAPSQTPGVPPEGVHEFHITAQRYAYSPGQLQVKLGDRVIIYLTSQDVDHGLALPDFGLNLRAPAGETVVGEFVASKAGMFAFYCPVDCGPGRDRMVGQLIVAE